MIRVKDPEKSKKFYEDVMGMSLKRTSENPNAKFNLYFYGYGPPAPEQSANGVIPTADREGLLELTWNYGTENDADFKYHDGNAEPKGFGHIAITVDDLDAACQRFEDLKVNWKKRLTDGKMKNVAFILGTSKSIIAVHSNPSVYNITNVHQILTVTGLKLCRTRSSSNAQTGELGLCVET
jgi:lactoylglutathione lyase